MEHGGGAGRRFARHPGLAAGRVRHGVLCGICRGEHHRRHADRLSRRPRDDDARIASARRLHVLLRRDDVAERGHPDSTGDGLRGRRGLFGRDEGDPRLVHARPRTGDGHLHHGDIARCRARQRHRAYRFSAVRLVERFSHAGRGHLRLGHRLASVSQESPGGRAPRPATARKKCSASCAIAI